MTASFHSASAQQNMERPTPISRQDGASVIVLNLRCSSSDNSTDPLSSPQPPHSPYAPQLSFKPCMRYLSFERPFSQRSRYQVSSGLNALSVGLAYR
jgi:hypothetical protein